MDPLDAVIYHLQIMWTWCKGGPGLSEKDCRKACEWITDALEVLEKIKQERNQLDDDKK